MLFCNRFTIGDKYDKSLESYVADAQPGAKFVIEKTLVGWNISVYVEPVQPVVEKLSPVEKPRNKEKKDAKQGISTAGRKTPRRRGSFSQR